MSFNDIHGNDTLKSRLQDIASSGNIHNGYIFEGPYLSEKFEFAKAFAQAISCPDKPGAGCGDCAVCRSIESGNYADLIVVEAESAEERKARSKADLGEDPIVKENKSAVKSIRDEQIYELQERLARMPVSGERLIAIIKNADTVTLRAYNRFLKTLEEPPAESVTILLSENADELPATIVSRCVKFRVLQTDAPSGAYARDLAREITDAISIGKPYCEIRKTIEKIGSERDRALAVLDCMEEIYADRMKLTVSAGEREYCCRAVELIEDCRSGIKRNRNIGYSIKCLALRIGG